MSVDLRLEVSLTDCTGVGTGDDRDLFADVFILDIEDGACDTFAFNVSVTNMLLPCGETDGDGVPTNRVFDGIPKVFANQVPFEVGRVYFLHLGFTDRAVCTNTIRILEGSTTVPGDLLPVIENAGPACVGQEVTYYAAAPLPATEYYFTVAGDTVSRGDSLVYTWGEVGDFELCLHANNLCAEGEVSCQVISVSAPDTVETTAFFCPGACARLPDGGTACTPGNYESVIVDAGGCPITYRTSVVAAFPDTTRLEANLCFGDTLNYRGVVYRDEGIYETVFANQRGCDSTVVLTINVNNCPVAGNISATALRCFGDQDGTVSLSLSSGTAPYTYQFGQLGGGVMTAGSVAGQNETVEFADLGEGTYLVVVRDAFGNEGFFNYTLLSPDPLGLNADLSDFNGFAISCANANDGSISLLPGGGIPSYTVVWEDGSPPMLNRTGLAAGTYSVRLEDANGCRVDTTITLDAPPPLSIRLGVGAETCGLAGSGSVRLETVSGGVAPLVARLGSTGITLGEVPTPLAAGSYSVEVEDANGCRLDTSFVITRPEVLELSIRGPERVALGEEADFSLLVSGAAASLTWMVEDSVRCRDCPDFSFLPLDDSWLRVGATSLDGCPVEDSLLVRVIPDYATYLPTAFSPNGDGVNDLFRPFFNGTASRLLTFRVYDRWGGLVYELVDEAIPLAGGRGWDGRVGNVPAAAGIFAWQAKVRFLNGEVRTLSGAVNLVR